MPKGIEKFDQIFEAFKAAGVDFRRMDSSDLALVKKVCDETNENLWLVNYEQLKSEYLNAFGRRYFGLDRVSMKEFGFGTLMEITHQEDRQNYTSIFTHYRQRPGEAHKNCVRLKNVEGEYRWVYIIQRAVSFSDANSPKYVLNLTIDIEDMLNNNIPFGNKAYLEKFARYDTLTSREKQILDLVASEYTSQEIAKQLFIESSTVDTHRKHILRKLKVKSSLGLVEYSLFYSEPAVKLRKVL